MSAQGQDRRRRHQAATSAPPEQAEKEPLTAHFFRRTFSSRHSRIGVKNRFGPDPVTSRPRDPSAGCKIVTLHESARGPNQGMPAGSGPAFFLCSGVHSDIGLEGLQERP